MNLSERWDHWFFGYRPPVANRQVLQLLAALLSHILIPPLIEVRLVRQYGWMRLLPHPPPGF